MSRRRRRHTYRFLVLGNGNPDFARMQMQTRLAEARTVSVDIVADNRPALSCRMDAQLVGAASNGFKGEPGEITAASHHFPVGDRRLPFGIDLLPPAAFGIESAKRHVDGALILSRAAFDDGPIGL